MSVVDAQREPVEGVALGGFTGRSVAEFGTTGPDGLACGDTPVELFALGFGGDQWGVKPTKERPYPEIHLGPVCRRRVFVDWGPSQESAARCGTATLIGPRGPVLDLSAGSPADSGPFALPCSSLRSLGSGMRGWELRPKTVASGTGDIHLECAPLQPGPAIWLTLVEATGALPEGTLLESAPPDEGPNRWHIVDGGERCREVRAPGRLAIVVCPPIGGWTTDTTEEVTLVPSRDVSLRCEAPDGSREDCTVRMTGTCTNAKGRGECNGFPPAHCQCPEGDAHIDAATFLPGTAFEGLALPDAESVTLRAGRGSIAVVSTPPDCLAGLYKVDGKASLRLGTPTRCESDRAVWEGLTAGAYTVQGPTGYWGPYSLGEDEDRQVSIGTMQHIEDEGLGAIPLVSVVCPGHTDVKAFQESWIDVFVPDGCTLRACGSEAGCEVAGGHCVPSPKLACNLIPWPRSGQPGDRERPDGGEASSAPRVGP